jgi:hypothetical protein
MTKYLGMLKLPRKLDTENYIAWKTTMESALQMQRLYEYVNSNLSPLSNDAQKLDWECANNLVRTNSDLKYGRKSF